MQGFADMRQDDYHETACAEELEKRADRLSVHERDERPRKQEAYGHERNQRFQ